MKGKRRGKTHNAPEEDVKAPTPRRDDLVDLNDVMKVDSARREFDKAGNQREELVNSTRE
jgi:hypothetical protein